MTHTNVDVSVTHTGVDVSVTHTNVNVSVTHTHVDVSVTHTNEDVSVTHTNVDVSVTHTNVDVSVAYVYVKRTALSQYETEHTADKSIQLCEHIFDVVYNENIFYKNEFSNEKYSTKTMINPRTRLCRALLFDIVHKVSFC